MRDVRGPGEDGNSDGCVDVLVSDSYPGPSGTVPDDLHADLLSEDPVRAYLAAGPDGSTVARLQTLRWVVEPAGSEANAGVHRVCRERGFEPDVAYESADLLFHLRMVQAGLAAAFLPDLLVRETKARLEPSSLLATCENRQAWLVCRSGAERRPAVTACREAFLHQLR